MNKDKLVYRILSGKVRIKINNHIFFVNGITSTQKYLGEELFDELYEEFLNELMSDEELMEWMISENYWSVEEENKLGQFKKDIEEFQVKLFELGFKGEEKATTKKLITHARDRMRELSNKKHLYDSLSARGMAIIEKNKYLIGLGLSNERGKPLFDEFNYLDHDFPLFDRIVIEYNKKTITGPQYREMARTEPWRQYWSARESVASLFEVPASLLTDEQLTLISWTKLYDSIFQRPNCPPDDVIEDDDALDGYLIKEKRKQDAEKDKNIAEELITNPKIKNAQEVFMVAGTKEAADRINNLNDGAAKATKKQRDKHIDKHGSVKEAELPDVKRRLQMEINAAKFAKG